MGALFSRRADRRVRVALTLLGATPILALLGLMVWVRTPGSTGQGRSPVQPVPFDHRIHVRGLGIDCRYCHAMVERSAYAGVPPTRTCQGCHQPQWLASRPFEPVRASLAGGGPVPWRRVHTLPDFVFFDHSIHVAKGVGCESCHGRVDRMAVVRQVAPLTMAWCLDCHRHPEASLRPPSEITTMGYRPAPDQPSGPALAERLKVRRVTHCSGCHR